MHGRASTAHFARFALTAIYYLPFLICILLIGTQRTVIADDFNLDSPYNNGNLRFELDNDAFWNEDSNFTNGWSIQYHTIRYASWEDTKAPALLKWVGNHFPTLKDENSVVRYCHGIGQGMISPGDLTNPDPPEGELPYAGTLTYTLNWQSFNQSTARIFQVSAGVMGKASLAEQFQRFVHVNLGLGDDPMGWGTQRASEPILNVAYGQIWRLGSWGNYTNGWAGQVSTAPVFFLGNLITSIDLGLSLRFGWNIQEGFNAFPAPPGYGLFMGVLVPKPKNASPHSVELILAAKAAGVVYSVVYDGSIITSDDRSVEREDFLYTGYVGLNYHYYKSFSVRLMLIYKTDTIKEETLPPAPPGANTTGTDNSYGALMIDFHF